MLRNLFFLVVLAVLAPAGVSAQRAAGIAMREPQPSLDTSAVVLRAAAVSDSVRRPLPAWPFLLGGGLLGSGAGAILASQPSEGDGFFNPSPFLLMSVGALVGTLVGYAVWQVAVLLVR